MNQSCDGCLGTAECWICTGEGCLRCAATGRCHLCRPEPVRLVLPVHREPVERGAPSKAAVS